MSTEVDTIVDIEMFDAGSIHALVTTEREISPTMRQMVNVSSGSRMRSRWGDWGWLLKRGALSLT